MKPLVAASLLAAIATALPFAISRGPVARAQTVVAGVCDVLGPSTGLGVSGSISVDTLTVAGAGWRSGDTVGVFIVASDGTTSPFPSGNGIATAASDGTFTLSAPTPEQGVSQILFEGSLTNATCGIAVVGG